MKIFNGKHKIVAINVLTEDQCIDYWSTFSKQYRITTERTETYFSFKKGFYKDLVREYWQGSGWTNEHTGIDASYDLHEWFDSVVFLEKAKDKKLGKTT